MCSARSRDTQRGVDVCLMPAVINSTRRRGQYVTITVSDRRPAHWHFHHSVYLCIAGRLVLVPADLHRSHGGELYHYRRQLILPALLSDCHRRVK